jgi:hypothetical protein
MNLQIFNNREDIVFISLAYDKEEKLKSFIKETTQL